HRKRQDRAHQVGDRFGFPLGKNAAVEKENPHRHDQAEKEKCFISQRDANAHGGKREYRSQSRSLLPVSSMNTSSREGVAISRLTSSLPCASRYFTSDTMAGAVRWQCSTYAPSTSSASATPSSCLSASFGAGLASRTSKRVVSPERCFNSRGVPEAINLP